MSATRGRDLAASSADSAASVHDTSRDYIGNELHIFAAATVWRRYVRDLLRPHLGARVLEVGAGLGTRTADLAPLAESWVALEPDPRFVDELRRQRASGELPASVEVVESDLQGVDGSFDTILYLDVLEHILDDRGELARAATRLTEGGRLVVLAPAHQALFSPFDRAVGHHRRYDRASISALTPPGVSLELVRYVDSAGLLASTANRFLLRDAHPGATQVASWDRILVRLSRILDPLTFGHLGKSVLAQWTRGPSGDS